MNKVTIFVSLSTLYYRMGCNTRGSFQDHEHPKRVMVYPSSVQQLEINDNVPSKKSVPKVPTKSEMDKAIDRLKNNTSAGTDAIPAELFKTAGTSFNRIFHQIKNLE
uniref:Uncharacterized protein n=1 Tax=Megaselia scalaris TaxID=36166 RepID=T1GSL0_MEGSC